MAEEYFDKTKHIKDSINNSRAYIEMLKNLCERYSRQDGEHYEDFQTEQLQRLIAKEEKRLEKLETEFAQL